MRRTSAGARLCTTPPNVSIAGDPGSVSWLMWQTVSRSFGVDGHDAVVALLLKLGANPDVVDDYGFVSAC